MFKPTASDAFAVGRFRLEIDRGLRPPIDSFGRIAPSLFHSWCFALDHVEFFRADWAWRSCHKRSAMLIDPSGFSMSRKLFALGDRRRRVFQKCVDVDRSLACRRGRVFPYRLMKSMADS